MDRRYAGLEWLLEFKYKPLSQRSLGCARLNGVRLDNDKKVLFDSLSRLKIILCENNLRFYFPWSFEDHFSTNFSGGVLFHVGSHKSRFRALLSAHYLSLRFWA